jgi:hypothetical protein
MPYSRVTINRVTINRVTINRVSAGSSSMPLTSCDRYSEYEIPNV